MKKTLYTMLASVSLALAACNSQPVAVEKTPIKKEIGVQLYSVRELIGNPELFAKNQATVLPQLAEMGYTTIETANYKDGKLYGMTPEDFKACIEKAGLKSLSTHTTRGLSKEELKAGAPSEETMKWWDECIAAHKAAGVEYIVNPWQNVPETLKDLKVWCDYHNAVGKKCAEAGLKFGYHNHSHEFQKVEDKVMIDFMIENTDPQYVFFELDVYWTVMGKASPVEYFKKYSGRFKLLHIKDHKEIGQSGMVGFDAIFKNAELAGVEHIVVEAEAYESADMMDGVRLCANYLLNADFVKAAYTK
jgi:sugar phosphate isomerase/epimerase